MFKWLADRWKRKPETFRIDEVFTSRGKHFFYVYEWRGFIRGWESWVFSEGQDFQTHLCHYKSFDDAVLAINENLRRRGKDKKVESWEIEFTISPAAKQGEAE